MKDYKRRINSTNTYLKIASIFLIITTIIAIGSFAYYKNLSYTIKEENQAYLKEISSRIGDSVDRIINDNFVGLNIMAASFENEKDMDVEEARALLTKQNAHMKFNDIMMIDKDGKGHSLQGQEMFVLFDEEVRKSILSGKPFVSATQIINNQEFVVFSVPLNNVNVGGKSRVALVGNYSASSFEKVLSMASFSEQAYSQLVTGAGVSITKPNTIHALNTGYNIFSSIEKFTFDAGSDIDTLKSDVLNKKTGQIGFSINEDHRYMTYTPINYNDWYLLSFVPVDVVNERSNDLLKSTLALCGIITITFAVLIASLYVVFKSNKDKLEKIAFVDRVTKGNTIQKFYNDAAWLIDAYPRVNYVVLYTNVEKFKVFNDTMGRENGDIFLEFFDKCIGMDLKINESIGRVGADNFCVILEYKGKEDLFERFSRWHKSAEEYIETNKLQWSLPSVQFGVYILDDKTLPISQMIDRAKLSLRESKSYFDSKIHYSFYDDKVRKVLFREKYLEDKMEKALKDGEFRVFLQPKYQLPEEKIGGAEALVRWISPEEGMIFPNEFISLFEQNGFITHLDLWVFEEVCKLIKSWKEKGYKPLKVSVNCSRVQLRNSAFLEKYTQIIDKYGVERSYIELEITETMVFENTESLMEIINNIRSAGFGCSMDDFGSGYSSLNMIQRIPVDTLKIDRIFFVKNSIGESEKTEAVVTSIVSMAKSLKMQTVAEGVEQREQVLMLERAGCDYIQGYVFAKPMTIGDFEKLAFNK